MERKDGHKNEKRSRFQVAKVDFATDSPAVRNYSDNSEGTEREPLTDSDKVSVSSAKPQSPDTHSSFTYARSLRQYTREALPRADHYRNVMSVHGHMNRPTLDELHDPTINQSPDQKYHKRLRNIEYIRTLGGTRGGGAIKLGWIQGVMVRCLLNIWGVMLFLRLSWVVGQAGIGFGSLVILLATAVTVLTTLSMSAICTNGEVKGGGTYYMISRSLGPEFGGSIGMIFALANAIAVAMYVVGFAEPLLELLKKNDMYIVDGGLNDIRIIGCVTVLFLFGIAIIGTEWESKAQLVLLVILLISMFDFLIGSFIPPDEVKKSQGFIGWDMDLMAENFGPNFRDETFISVFSVYFPAATGILAGANISGDLADPQMAIPKGTFIAILVTTISYLWFAFTSGSTVLRDANGLLGVANITLNGSVVNDTIIASQPVELTSNFITNCTLVGGKCKFGLLNNYEVMEMVAAFGPIIYAGIFAATLSSALASLVSAPKVFQALCKDKLFPHIEGFAKGYGKSGEPRRAYCLAFAIALACTAIGELNAIAPIISNFFLAAYCLINFSCFHASFARSPGFRPAFKYYNMWLSLLGAILCLSVMFIMKWWTALLTFALILALYICIHYRKPDVNWGSSTQAQTYKTALNSVFKLNHVQEHVKNYRPQIMVLTGTPSSRPPLVDFAYLITKKLSLMVCGHVVQGTLSQRGRNAYAQTANKYLHKRKVKAFYTIVEDEVFSHGVGTLLQLYGVGKLRPNALFMGYKSKWQESTIAEVIDYFNTIHEAFDKHLSLGILRLPEGLDYSEYDIEEGDENVSSIANGDKSAKSSLLKPDTSDNSIPRNSSSAQLSQDGSSRDSTPPSTPTTERANTVTNSTKSSGDDPNSRVGQGTDSKIPKNVLSTVNQFQRKQKKGSIDVWWLYDDGGFTLLIPYLLTMHSQFSNNTLRVFSLANKKDELEMEQRSMAGLLNKFRIDYSDVLIIPDIQKLPQESSKQDFENLLTKWKEEQYPDEEKAGMISEAEILALKEKINRHIRLREMLIEYSKDSTLIVMTLPMPRKTTCSAPMYMSWLETLTRDMPPFLLIRGNQESVLTFYS